ncbi:LacI family DNA-binding transcriptional regulator [Domibacillus sp. DTU_2020_1001157_1_SI_ALB_TIR_016]|uniref:LacI family DNA-binding transcriptional regulator n=1 Tax=Domibacillus sp. DTU_2020_1001157_1_SI_ALB_TIR_016 TaxID=3077789 RepID=UPI0028EC9A01|nr:LacI family DNA-binding transcriptional regulator [Domibacillus sp. DTU_2020_1001157_1_SI_ALB_TIR_016]WNS78782.1 LacI family DNA-binding transcriptional regulator [Domibacillus sp. DTU_2020_1001157_1_SI_ALB_TIR_016]
MVNIRDLAKMAGVGTSTVSRVLNDHPYVSEKSREAVLKAIKSTNYQKNINAIHLKMGKTFLIGVALPFLNHPYFGKLLEGISVEAERNNYKLVLFQTNYKVQRETEVLEMLKAKQIDALIICSKECEWEMIESYRVYGPIVLCEDTRNRNVSSVFIDHYENFLTALEYLYEKGHQRIGYCVGRRTGTNSEMREAAYRNFLKKHNQPFFDPYIFEGCLYLEDAKRMMEKFLKMKNPPTALLVTSDQVAAGILNICNHLQLSVPDDLAIVGFDNQPIAEIMSLTTFEMPLFEIGRKLFLYTQEKDKVFYEEMEVKLIERNTV